MTLQTVHTAITSNTIVIIV